MEDLIFAFLYFCFGFLFPALMLYRCKFLLLWWMGGDQYIISQRKGKKQVLHSENKLIYAPK